MGLVLSVAAPSATALALVRSRCDRKELKGKDCRLISGAYNLRLTGQTVVWNDGTWHTVDPMPLSGEGVEWESVRFDFINKMPILQLWLWDKGVGDAQVQSLHWYVADAEKRQFTVLAEGVVRKRHLKEVPPAEAAASAPAAAQPGGKTTGPSTGKVTGNFAGGFREAKGPPAAKFLYDAMESHSLKPVKNGKLEWTLGRQKQILERGNPDGI